MKDNYFEILYNVFSSRISKEVGGSSISSFTDYLGVSRGKVDAWKKGQHPKAEDLRLLHDKLGIAYRWLVTGEGDPFEEETGNVTIVMKKENPLTLFGFASCGIDGWGGTIPYSVSVTLPSVHEGMIAVMASGDSMIPAGIGSGQICYCDTTKEPGLGDAVYVQRTDGLGAIKVYLGKGMPGLHIPDEGKTAFQGWLSPADGAQKPFFMDVSDDALITLAPVIFVQRRM